MKAENGASSQASPHGEPIQETEDGVNSKITPNVAGASAGVQRLPSWWKQDWFLGLVLAVVLLLAYQPAWHGTLLWDDDQHLTRPELRSWAGLGRIWFNLTGSRKRVWPIILAVAGSRSQG